MIPIIPPNIPRQIQLALLVALALPLAAAADDAKLTVLGSGHTGLSVLRGDVPLFHFEEANRGTKWNPLRSDKEPSVSAAEGRRQVRIEKLTPARDAVGGDSFALEQTVEQIAPDTVRVGYRVTPEGDMAFGVPQNAASAGIGPLLPASTWFDGGTLVVTPAQGEAREFALPPGSGSEAAARSVTLRTAQGSSTTLTFDQPAYIHLDRSEVRCFLQGEAKAGQTTELGYTIQWSEPIAFEPANRLVDLSEWFPVRWEEVDDVASPSETGMEAWLHQPAGKHGWVGFKGKELVFADGTPVKFWGVNQSWTDVAPPLEIGPSYADKWAKHGVNLVRMHKFVGQRNRGLNERDDSQKLNEDIAVRWDHFNAELKKRGIHTGWSPFYAFALTPADKDRIWAYDEIMAAKHGPPWYHGSTIGLVNFAPDLQELHIGMLKTLLNRKNTVTGLRYADDPMLAYVEIQNEDDIFFGYQALVDSCPTYKKYIDGEFSKWLAKKYADQNALAAAWGAQLKKGESLEQGNIAAFTGRNDSARRTQDAYAFLYEQQDAYYKRVKQAIRDTGYQGAVVGSCWQAQSFLGHLYNVRSDREIGFIDRHNYGGVNMLLNPGKGLLSAGMQQVGDRPYALTEWAGGGVYNGLEAVPVIGLIGMGVQGWDISAHFGSSHHGIHRDPAGINNQCDRFDLLAHYPAIARALYRHDITESEPVARRIVSIPGMADNSAGFSENFSLLGGANIKEFSAVVPQETLALGPVMLDFVDGPVEKPVLANFEHLFKPGDRRLTSASGQVFWDWSQRGFFTVNTPGTKALIGYGEGRRHELGEVAIRSHTPLSFIYVTAADPGETIATAKRILVTAIARVDFEGQQIDEPTMKNLTAPPAAKSGATMLVEPVRAEIEIKGVRGASVTPLDHGGRRPKNPAPVPVEAVPGGVRFTLDGAKTQTFNYLVEMNQSQEVGKP